MSDLDDVLRKVRNAKDGDGWYRMDSFPRDGSDFLCLHHSGNIEIRHWDRTMQALYPGGSSEGWFTHWRPLPDKPNEDE